MSPNVAQIYKVCQSTLFQASLEAGHFLGAPVDTEDGFIHFSTAEQLLDTLRLYFAGQSDLVLFALAVAPLGGSLVWEPSRGGQLFPHLYGELRMNEIGDVATIAVAADGEVTLPEWVK